MAVSVNMKVILCFSWLVALTTTVKGYTSCGEIQNAKENRSGLYTIEIGGKNVQVSCNLTSQPAVTVIPVDDVVKVPNPGSYGSPKSYLYNVNYGTLSADDIRAFIEERESCKQYVSYKCSNATLFGNKQSPLSSWTSVKNNPKEYWAGCSFSDKTCQCDQGKSMSEEDAGYLTKKKDLPVKGLQIGGLSSGSNVSVTIGDIVCYGDSQKGAFTFKDRNAFVSLNVSSMKELKFKFKLLKSDENKIIASIRINERDVKIGLNSKSELFAGAATFSKLDEEWHSIVLTVEGKTTNAVVDGVKKLIFETALPSTVGPKLVMGSLETKCNTFIGCVKDLTVNGQDYTKMITEAKVKEFVTKGCSAPQDVQCSEPTVQVGPNVDPTVAANPTASPSPSVNSSGDGKNNNTGNDGNVDDGGGGGGNSDSAIIAIVVVFLILLIILIVVFFITWYLKRNKGVYQTHEGSAENIHGDTDNLTLVTKPCDQEPDGDKGKEYYL